LRAMRVAAWAMTAAGQLRRAGIVGTAPERVMGSAEQGAVLVVAAADHADCAHGALRQSRTTGRARRRSLSRLMSPMQQCSIEDRSWACARMSAARGSGCKFAASVVKPLSTR